MAAAGRACSSFMTTKKIIFGAGCLALATMAFAAQKFDFARVFKAGQKSDYLMTVDLKGQMAMNMKLEIVQTVNKVDPDGGAEISSAAENLNINFNGQTMTPPDPPAQVYKVNKYGIPDKAAAAAEEQNPLAPLMKVSSYIGEAMKGGATVGEPLKFDTTDPTTKTRATGSVTVDSITDNVATIDATVDVYTNGGTQPMHVVTHETVDATTKEMESMTSDVTGLATTGAQMMQNFDTAHLTMKLKS